MAYTPLGRLWEWKGGNPSGEMMQEVHFEIISALLKAMSHPIRLKILYALVDGAKSTGDLLQHIPTTNPNLSQHLNVLRDYGLINSHRNRSFVINQLTDERIKVLLIDIKSTFAPGEA